MRLPENKLIAWGTVAGALLTAASLLVGGIVYSVRLRDDATASRQADCDHETRLRTVEGDLADMHGDVRVIKTDVRWIREYLGRLVPCAPAGKETAKTAAN